MAIITEGYGIGGQAILTPQAMGKTVTDSFYSATASSVTSSFSASTPPIGSCTIWRICSMSGPIAYAIGPAPVATTTSTPLPSATVEYRCVSPGDKFAAISLS
jgi:hypothetical protein